MHETVIIDTEITEKDVAPLRFDALKYFFSNPSLIIVLAFLVVFVLYITGFRFSADTLSLLPLPFFLILTIFLIFFTAVFRGSGKSYRKNKMYRNMTHFEFSDEKILVSSKYGEISMQWNEMHSVREGKTAFILTPTGKDECIIARRNFVTDKQMKDFLALLESNVDASKRILKKYPFVQPR